MAEGRSSPQPGDLIEIYRPGGYRHWALYVGDGYVIHVTDVGPRDVLMSVRLSSTLTGTAMVKKELLEDVAKKPNWRVNNTYDKDHTPRPVEDIIRDAEHFVGVAFEYNLMNNNCEHFVTLLRYDEKFSKQVKNAMKYGGVASLLIFSAIVTAWLKFSKKKKLRAQVQNVEREIPGDRNVEVKDAVIAPDAAEADILSDMTVMMGDLKFAAKNKQRSIPGKVAEFQNEARKIPGELSEEPALLTTAIPDTFYQTHAMNIK